MHLHSQPSIHRSVSGDDEGCPANLVSLPLLDIQADEDDVHLERVARRADGALESLYQAVAPRLYAVAMRMLGDEGESQEVVQDAFVRIWERAATYNADLARPFTWMVMILRGLCLDRLRKRRVRSSLRTVSFHAEESFGRRASGVGLESLASPGDAFLRSNIIEELRQAFDTLPASDQALLHRVLFTPIEIAELAEDLGQPEGTVKSRIHRAITKLRILLRWDHE
jgi:RNA polymerase sigma-70 factor, ECF subfamily